jgi:8-oxo-dGTP pyrophosphatase MutT (NUDIX family)
MDKSMDKSMDKFMDKSMDKSTKDSVQYCKQGCCSLKIKFKQKKFEQAPKQPFEKRKAGVFIFCGKKILLTQSYNNCWGIPKGRMEPFDSSIKECAERELIEETGFRLSLTDNDLYKILENCYVFKINVKSMDVIPLENLDELDSTGLGWVDINCAHDFNLNFLTKKLLVGCLST